MQPLLYEQLAVVHASIETCAVSCTCISNTFTVSVFSLSLSPSLHLLLPVIVSGRFVIPAPQDCLQFQNLLNLFAELDPVVATRNPRRK